ncbi:hypothetical protein F2Q69_00062571 [Brassica cretica]|uniref:Uncharacterized protein n=1 Tax=Brassica cretica TaxID=69181 RepID=A0A8S9RKQ8_BRACR|nr:hypothetical protein F2Q69_00062571 [Brassica cretica]
MVGGVWSEDMSLQLEATTLFRKLLSIVGALRDSSQSGAVGASRTCCFTD